jgi:DnaJ-class molecular chaperone
MARCQTRETGKGDRVDMGKTFNPQKYNMAFCSDCNGKGKLTKIPGEFDVCRRCGGFGIIKNESEIFEEVNNKE